MTKLGFFLVAFLSLAALPKAFAPPSTGLIKALYVIINFSDDPTAPSVQTIEKAVLLDPMPVRNFYLDISYGKLNVDTTVVGPVTISASVKSNFDPNSWCSLAKEKLQSRGRNLLALSFTLVSMVR